MEVNAVFEGGGIKGISLAGAVYAAERRGIAFRHLGGSSVGAIVSALLAAGYRADDMRRIIEETPFRSFLKRSPVFNVRVVGPALRLLLMSASIPYFFDPVLMRQREGEIRIKNGFHGRFAYIVDGAILSNFPMWLFDKEEMNRSRPVPTVGFRMVGKNDNEPRNIRGPLTMLQAMFETMMQAHDERYIERSERDRTIKIPTLGVRSTQFDIDEGTIRKLFDSGRDAADSFFQTFDQSNRGRPRAQ